MNVFRLVCSDYDMYIACYVAHRSATPEMFLASCQSLKPRALRIALTLKRSKLANDPEYPKTNLDENDLQEGFLRAFEELGYWRYEMPSFDIDHRTWTNPPDPANPSCAFGEEASIRAFWGEELYAELSAYNEEIAARAKR